MSDVEAIVDQSLTELLALDHTQRFSIAGAIACVLSKISNYHDIEGSFREIVLSSVCKKLNLTSHDEQSLAPIIAASSECIEYVSPRPYIDEMFEDEKDEESAEKLKSKVIVGLMNIFLAELEGYDSRVRTILKALTEELGLSYWWFVEQELNYATGLSNFLEEHDQKSQEGAKERQAKSKTGRWLKIGAAAILGGGLLVVTGGLAAPAIAVGVGAMGMGGAALFLSSTVGVALVTSVFGATGAGLTGFKVKKVVSDVDEFEFRSVMSLRSLHVVLGVNGILTKKEKAIELYDCLISLSPTSDIYQLVWETPVMVKVGNAVSNFVTNQAIGTVIKHGIMRTVAATVFAAIAWPSTILSMADLIDNPWSMAISKSDKAGLLLADAIASQAHGKRPISLIGYSFGARVIITALKTLVEKQDPSLRGIIEDVFILGAPYHVDAKLWKRMRGLVAGRFVNGYLTEDWVLGFAYRTAHVSTSVAGISPIPVEGIDNVNLKGVVDGHYDYEKKLQDVLKAVNFQDGFALPSREDVHGTEVIEDEEKVHDVEEDGKPNGLE